MTPGRPGGYFRFTGFTFQISSAYCWMVRSELNLPIRATLMIAIRVHFSLSWNVLAT